MLASLYVADLFVRDQESWRQLQYCFRWGSLGAFFRGFYFGEARIPGFITEKNFRMTQCEARLESSMDLMQTLEQERCTLVKGSM
jgi:hypothetical protein